MCVKTAGGLVDVGAGTTAFDSNRAKRPTGFRGLASTKCRSKSASVGGAGVAAAQTPDTIMRGVRQSRLKFCFVCTPPAGAPALTIQTRISTAASSGGQLRRRPRLMGVGPRASAWDRRYRVSWDLKDTLRVNLPPYPKVARWCAGVKRRRTTNEDDPGRPTTAVAADMLKVERNCSSRSSGHSAFVAEETKIYSGYSILH
ncbi:hypothetical protein EVAR_101201_1 [Eumeta japonica]|uniref:Uncharacterized protein n=1 Tax=Eumeta variegata TaxID=151549 RepID=A0A4C2ACB1_EUMVA|nr:hypothetical protein EVAR_101201_1 [Eumeta japonica]